MYTCCRDLIKLYEQLVVAGVLTAEEFWKGRAHLLTASSATTQQRVGLSSAMLTSMQPCAAPASNHSAVLRAPPSTQSMSVCEAASGADVVLSVCTSLSRLYRSADGKSDTVRVKLTPAMVHQIFAEKPHVKRAFQANVPTRIMTHNEFWAKYLRHQLLQQVCICIDTGYPTIDH